MDFDLREGYLRLKEYYDEWLLSNSNREKSNIEESVVRIINNRHYIPDEIYVEVNEGSASGLCQHGFFENDLQKLINCLRHKIETQ